MSAPQSPVIAGVSGDQPSVIAFALREAARLGTSLRVVHCYSEHLGDSYVGTEPDEPMRAAGVAVLQQARTVVKTSDTAVEVDYLLEHGDAGSVLIDHAKCGAVLVVGANDVSWLARMFGGEVSGRLALHAACPVIVVPRTLAVDAAVDGVVVTLDGDTSAAGPLRYGFEQAASRHQGLHVLHATPAATSEADEAAIGVKVRVEVERWNELTPAVHARLSLTNGDSLEECLQATVDASLLVIGRPHGEGHLFALARPVAMRVLREARCPVSIVPAQYGPVPGRVGPGDR